VDRGIGRRFVRAVCASRRGCGIRSGAVDQASAHRTIAGMTGAYGNVGAVVYLTVLSFVDYHTFFFVIAGTAVLGFITLLFMDEPSGHMAEVREDGTVELISVARATSN